MISNLLSKTHILEPGLHTLTFNPFDMLGVCFMSYYPLEDKPNNLIVKASNFELNLDLVKPKILVDFSKPLILDKDIRLSVDTKIKTFICLSTFIPSKIERQKFLIIRKELTVEQ